jgi:predicted secreted protein
MATTLKMTGSWLCNVTVDSTAVVNDTITYYLTYNGLNCNGKLIRTGKQEIKKKVGTHWGMTGATVITTLIDFHVVHVNSGKAITLNGTRTHENVSGGFIWQLGTGGATSIVHKITGNLQATFDDTTTRTWSLARQLVYTGTPTALVMTTDGFGSADGYSNLITWGVSRNGEQFYTQVLQSVVHRQACNWDPVSGIVKHQVPSDNKSATVTYGYDSNNQPITGDECPTRYRVDWVKNGHSGTMFLPLPN